MSTLKVRGHMGFDSIKCETFLHCGGCHAGSASTKSPGDAWRREEVQSHLLISEKEVSLVHETSWTTETVHGRQASLLQNGNPERC